MLDSVAYKTYYAISLGAKPLKSKKVKMKFDSAISFEETPSNKKPTKAKKDVPSKKSQLPNLNRLRRRYWLRLIEEKGFLMSNNERLLGDSGEEDDDDDDEDDTEDESDDDGNDDNGDSDDNDDDSDDERIELDKDEIPDPNMTNEEHEEDDEYDDERVYTPPDYELHDEEKIDDEVKMDEEKIDEEEDDDVTKELYKDVNVNLENKDADMTEVKQRGADQHNVSYRSGFEQETEDAHVTLTTFHVKTEGPMQSSSVSFDFTSKLLNLDNPFPDDNEITSLMNTATILLPLPLINPPQQQTKPTPTPTTSKETTTVPSHPDFAFVFRFNDRVTNLERDLSEVKQVDQYAQALFSNPALLDFASVFKLNDRVTNLERDLSEVKQVDQYAQALSFIPAMELYDALVKSYQTDKDLFDTYGEVFTLKRSRDDRDKDQDPSTGSDRGTKRRKLSKEAESSSDSRSKEMKSSSTSKDASHSQHKPYGKSTNAEELSHTVDDSGV
nr:hypothetical protein [Tanacetum cinerariifolium]